MPILWRNSRNGSDLPLLRFIIVWKAIVSEYPRRWVASRKGMFRSHIDTIKSFRLRLDCLLEAFWGCHSISLLIVSGAVLTLNYSWAARSHHNYSAFGIVAAEIPPRLPF